MNEPYNPRLNGDRELIVCEECNGMFYGDPKDPICSSCRHKEGWDGNGSPVE